MNLSRKGHVSRTPNVLGDRCICFLISRRQTAQVPLSSPLLLILMVPHCGPKTTYICLSHVHQYSRHPIYIPHATTLILKGSEQSNSKIHQIKKKIPCPISAEITIIENAMRINVPWIRFSKDSHSWKPPGLPFSKVPLCGERLTRKQSI